MRYRVTSSTVVTIVIVKWQCLSLWEIMWHGKQRWTHTKLWRCVSVCMEVFKEFVVGTWSFTCNNHRHWPRSFRNRDNLSNKLKSPTIIQRGRARCLIRLQSVTWASCQIREIAGCACAGNAGNVFPRHWLQRKTLVSDPGMHHGTCVTHVPWCMSGSLEPDGGENVPGIPGACAPAIFRIWQEAHLMSGFPLVLLFGETWNCSCRKWLPTMCLECHQILT